MVKINEALKHIVIYNFQKPILDCNSLPFVIFGSCFCVITYLIVFF